MLALRDLQAAMRRACLGGDAAVAAAEVHGDGLAPEARLGIYRHHVLDTLAAVLAATFPVVRRLVDRGFFAYAADTYVRAEPPAGPCLIEYGATFPDFLAAFPPCAGLPYLGDVARLEWAVHRAAHADDPSPVDLARLAAVPAEDMPRLTFRLMPSLSLLASPWPVDRIWAAQRDTSHEPGRVELDGGAVWLEVGVGGGDVEMRRVDRPRHVFRAALARGHTLEAAAARAQAADAAFDLTRALRDLLDEEVLVDFATAHSINDDTRGVPAWP